MPYTYALHGTPSVQGVRVSRCESAQGWASGSLYAAGARREVALRTYMPRKWRLLILVNGA